MGLKSHEIPPAHEVIKGDPRIDGPYLDDHNASYEAARREARLTAQERQKEVVDSSNAAPTEGTELGYGEESRVISETPTTITTVTTESKVEEPEPVENDTSGSDENE